MQDLNNLKAGDVVFVKSAKDYDNITKDKIYRCELGHSGDGWAIIDNDYGAYILLDMGCAYLNNGYWEILPEKVGKYYARFGQLPPKELEELCLK